MKIMMKRTVKEKERYYTLQLLPNLFGESIVIRIYGSSQKAKPTGVICDVYSDAVDAGFSIDVLIAQKQKRGYQSKEATSLK